MDNSKIALVCGFGIVIILSLVLVLIN